MDDETARQFFASPVEQGRDDPDLVLIDEPCPHCRVRLHMHQPRDMARKGFPCAECGKGLIRMQHVGSKMLALVGVSMSSLLFACLALPFGLVTYFCIRNLVVEQSPLELVLLFGVGGLIMAGLAFLMARISLANLRVLWRIFSGARLLPAIETGGAYRYEATPLRFKFQRNAKGREALVGAMTEARGDDVSLRGALTQDPHTKDP